MPARMHRPHPAVSLRSVGLNLLHLGSAGSDHVGKSHRQSHAILILQAAENLLSALVAQHLALDVAELVLPELAVVVVDHARHEHQSSHPGACQRLGANVRAVDTRRNGRHPDHLLVAFRCSHIMTASRCRVLPIPTWLHIPQAV